MAEPALNPSLTDRWKSAGAGRRSALASALALALLGSAVVVLLWPQWLHNAELSHGFFMPLLFLILLHEGTTRGTQRYLPDAWWTTAGIALLGVSALVLLSLGGLYALALDWSHSIASTAPTAAFVCLGLASLLTFSRRSLRLVPLNWTTVLAFGLWLLCAPLPPGTYQRISLHLQLGVTHGVIVALHLLGAPAIQQGNVIELAHTSVGVEEACSGIRSLISCVFAGTFFSACLVRRPIARLLLIALAGPLAIVMNFVRSLILTLLANDGVQIQAFWHDATGYAILLVTALVLAGLAFTLSHGPHRETTPPFRNAPKASAPPRFALALLLTSLTSSLALAGFLAACTRPTGILPAKAPVLKSLIPTEAAAPGWTVTTVGGLQRFAPILQTKTLLQRDYIRKDPDGPTLVTLYVAYWAPGQSTPSQVAIHTPDGCWPGAGWIKVPEKIDRQSLDVDGRVLAPAEFRVFTSPGGIPENVWYWHLYDGKPIEQLDPYAIKGLLTMALRYGFHRGGEQLFVRISSNRPWSRIERDPLIQGFFQNLKPQGL